MTARTKIDVHARTLSMELGDTLCTMKHPTEDHSLFGIGDIGDIWIGTIVSYTNIQDPLSFLNHTRTMAIYIPHSPF
ncbi:hypothetical protein CR513_39738, partial [Mucuna pruriens]